MTGLSDQEIIDAAIKARRDALKKDQRKAHATTTVAPITGPMSAGSLASLDNWRAFFHNLVGVIVPVLVTLHITTQDTVSLWLPFVFAIADNVLSVGNSKDKFRRSIYAVVGLLQTGGLVTSVLTTSVAPEYVSIGSAVLATASAFMARFFTPTTSMVPRTESDVNNAVDQG